MSKRKEYSKIKLSRFNTKNHLGAEKHHANATIQRKTVCKKPPFKCEIPRTDSRKGEKPH